MSDGAMSSESQSLSAQADYLQKHILRAVKSQDISPQSPLVDNKSELIDQLLPVLERLSDNPRYIPQAARLAGFAGNHADLGSPQEEQAAASWSAILRKEPDAAERMRLAVSTAMYGKPDGEMARVTALAWVDDVNSHAPAQRLELAKDVAGRVPPHLALMACGVMLHNIDAVDPARRIAEAAFLANQAGVVPENAPDALRPLFEAAEQQGAARWRQELMSLPPEQQIDLAKKAAGGRSPALQVTALFAILDNTGFLPEPARRIEDMVLVATQTSYADEESMPKSILPLLQIAGERVGEIWGREVRDLPPEQQIDHAKHIMNNMPRGSAIRDQATTVFFSAIDELPSVAKKIEAAKFLQSTLKPNSADEKWAAKILADNVARLTTPLRPETPQRRPAFDSSPGGAS